MAVYAALACLMNLIHDLQHHPFPPISLDKQQVESLDEKVSFLQEFLEAYTSPVTDIDIDEADPLDIRLADAAYAAEDVIESHIVGVIKLRRSTTTTRDRQTLEENDSSEENESDDDANDSGEEDESSEENDSGEETTFSSGDETRPSSGENVVNCREEGVSCINLYEEMDSIMKDAMKMKIDASTAASLDSGRWNLQLIQRNLCNFGGCWD